MGVNGLYLHDFPDSDDMTLMATAFGAPSFRRSDEDLRNFLGQTKGLVSSIIINFNNVATQIIDDADATFGVGNHTLSVVAPAVNPGDPINNSVKISVTTNENPSQFVRLLFAGDNNVSREITYKDLDVSPIDFPPDPSIPPSNNAGAWIDVDQERHTFAGFGPPHGEVQIVDWEGLSITFIAKGFGFRVDYFMTFGRLASAFLMRDHWENAAVNTFWSFAIPYSGQLGLTHIMSFRNFATGVKPQLRLNYGVKPIIDTIAVNGGDDIPIGTPVAGPIMGGNLITVKGSNLLSDGVRPLMDFTLTRELVFPIDTTRVAQIGATDTECKFIVPSAPGGTAQTISMSFARIETAGD
ncbi:hypothetical protein LCGC14_2427430, partial [marine sediment metagenome]